jgi:hypothetical protein
MRAPDLNEPFQAGIRQLDLHAAALKRLGELALSFGRDHSEQPGRRATTARGGFDSGAVVDAETVGQLETEPVQGLEKVVGQIGLGFVDLVDQQHGGGPAAAIPLQAPLEPRIVQGRLVGAGIRVRETSLPCRLGLQCPPEDAGVQVAIVRLQRLVLKARLGVVQTPQLVDLGGQSRWSAPSARALVGPQEPSLGQRGDAVHSGQQLARVFSAGLSRALTPRVVSIAEPVQSSVPCHPSVMTVAPGST